MSRPRSSAAATAAALALLVATPVAAQELRYSLTPTAQWVKWDDALGIADAYLYGGRAGFTFGQYLELQGYYLTRGRIDQELGDFDPGLPESLPSTLGIRNYGADIVLNLASTRFRPFVRAGGSILRFAPEGEDATRQIALRYGGGLRFGNPGQIRVQIYAEDLVFRVDRGRLVGQPVGNDPQANDLRHNLVYGAGLTVPLGGATTGDDRPRFSLSNFSLPVEVFGGVLNFDDEIGFDGQNVVGARTGVNFGPLVSLRGYYWRGVTDGFSGFQGIQSWGGEGHFRLNAGSGLNPYLIAGAGQLDFLADYDAAASPIAPDDRAMLILGGGIALELTSRLRLDLAARNHLFNAEGELADAARADDLVSNWMLSAGLGFDIGGTTSERAPAPRVPVVARVDTVVVDRETGTVVRAARGAERTELREPADDSVVVRRVETLRVVAGDTVRTMKVDTLRGERAALARDEACVATLRREEAVRRGADQRADSLQARVDALRADSLRAVRTAGGDVEPAPPRGYASERTIAIPVPTQGELYVRYGPADSVRGTAGADGVVRPGALRSTGSDAEATRQAIRDILREELDRRDVGGDTTLVADRERRALFERRLVERVDSAIAARASRAPIDPGVPVTSLREQDELREAERQRLLEDIERIVRTQVQLEMDRRRDERPAVPAVVEPVSPSPVVVPASPAPARPLAVAPDDAPARPAPTAQPGVRPGRLPQPRSFSVYAGINVNEDAQLVLGGRVSVGPIVRGTPNLLFVPEFALGLGEGATTFLNANAQYRPRAFDVRDFGLVQLYGQVGVGAYMGKFEGDRQFDLTLNPAYGLEFTVDDLRRTVGTSQLFAEHQGVDFFKRNRFVVGLRWPY